MAKQSALMRMVAENEERLKRKYDFLMQQAFEFCEQWCVDEALIAAADTFGLSPSELKRFGDCLMENLDKFVEMWNEDSEDCEYTMVKQDERLKEVCGEYFMPYEERYTEKVSEVIKRWLGK